MAGTKKLCPIVTDAVVIGAGPVGLFQVFELGLLGFSAHVIEVSPHVGGQPIELYADKPIYDIPGIVSCTGRELTERLIQQCAPFRPTIHTGHQVNVLSQQPNGRWRVFTDRRLELLTRTVFIAAGVGAFQPKRLKIAGVDRYEDAQLHYHVPNLELLAEQHVLVSGGGNSALDCVNHLASMRSSGTVAPASVTLLHRRDGFQATPERISRMRKWLGAGQLNFMVGQIVDVEEADGRLQAALVRLSDGQQRPVSLDHLVVLHGLSPKLGPIADWSLALEHKQLVVDTEKFQTSAPGIYAVGDVNTYPGKRKLILCGFHEATLAAYAAREYISPQSARPIEYTTSSTRLHALLQARSAGTLGHTD